MKQTTDFLADCKNLWDLLNDCEPNILELQTQFKNWSINDIIGHLYLFNVLACETLKGPNAFNRIFRPFVERLQKTQSFIKAQEPWIDNLEGTNLLEAWWLSCHDLAVKYSKVDPKTRVTWAGPEMSARSAITARQMETWAHGHEIFDRIGKKRIDGDHVQNIVHLGVSTFGWTFRNRGLAEPKKTPHLILNLPSGQIIKYNEVSDTELIEGRAVEFCQVVTQTRNIQDTGLKINGPISHQWMEIAQCFAGTPQDPPEAGTRFLQT